MSPPVLVGRSSDHVTRRVTFTWARQCRVLIIELKSLSLFLEVTFADVTSILPCWATCTVVSTFKKQMRGGGQTSSFRGVPLNEVIILGVLETEQFAVSHMFHVFEEHYQTCQILGRRFFILCGRFFPLVPKHPMFLFPPPLSSQESIYANSPGYSTDLLLSCKGHKISQIKWAFELFCALV